MTAYDKVKAAHAAEPEKPYKDAAATELAGLCKAAMLESIAALGLDVADVTTGRWTKTCVNDAVEIRNLTLDDVFKAHLEHSKYEPVVVAVLTVELSGFAGYEFTFQFSVYDKSLTLRFEPTIVSVLTERHLGTITKLTDITL